MSAKNPNFKHLKQATTLLNDALRFNKGIKTILKPDQFVAIKQALDIIAKGNLNQSDIKRIDDILKDANLDSIP